MAKVKNRFEQVDEIQSDAITLSLGKDGDKEYGVVVFSASASAGRLVQDSISGQLAPQDSFRSAIKLARDESGRGRHGPAGCVEAGMG